MLRVLPKNSAKLFAFAVVLTALQLFTNKSGAQSILYFQNFGSPAVKTTTLPAGWVASGAETSNMGVQITNPSTGYTIAGTSATLDPTPSGGGQLEDGENTSVVGTAIVTLSGEVNTVGYGNITIQYAGYATSTYTTPPTLAWSIDGTTWNTISYTAVPTTSVWTLVNSTPIALPAGAAGQSNLQFQWTFVRVGTGGSYRIDDFTVEGIACSGAAITGTATVTAGATTTLSDATTGGTWSSGSTGVATAGSTTGIVSGVTAGTSVITYMLASGCAATATVTVSASSGASITGTATVCAGSSTTLSDASAGTWSSGSTSVATIDGSGDVYGVSTGTSIITYTYSGGGSTTKTITVNTSPASIGGTWGVCAGSTTTLTETSTGGTWSSSNTSLTTVSGGVVNGVAAGVDSTYYTLSNGCFANATVTVNPLPNAGTITGIFTAVIGGSTTLIDGFTGGAWSSSITAVATIGSSAGTVTGVATGTTIVTYTISNGCGTAMTTTSVRINTLIDYWNFNSYATPYTYPATFPLGPINADYSIISTATAGVWFGTDPGTSSSWHSAEATIMDPYTTVTADYDTVNLQQGAPGGVSIRPRNPLDSAYLYYYIPTTGYRNIALAYASESSSTSSGDGEQWFDYSDDSGVTWNNALLSEPYDSAWPVFKRITVSFTSDSTVNNNSRLVFRIHFVNHVTGTSGNNRFDNITVTGDPYSILTAQATYGPFCNSGSNTISIGYTNTGSYAGTWSVQLSNVGGTFPSNTTSNIIGTGSSSPISATIPSGTTAGTYRVRVINTSPATYGSDNGTNIIISAPPGTIGGTTTVCAGSSTTLTEATTGGSWSSINTGVATVNTSGSLSGVGAGTTIISYTVMNNCGIVAATQVVTVNPLPVAGTMGGTAIVCAGSSIGLTDAATGGSWSSVSTGVATVNTSGSVSGVSAGTSTISYTVTNGCGTGAATQVVTVNPLPAAGTISGTANMCAGSSTGLTDAATGGSWSSITTGVATVNASGSVSGVSAGISTISYTVANGCGTAAATQVVTVSPLPVAGTIGGTAIVCAGSSTGLTDAATGGSWSSITTGVATVNTSGSVNGLSAGTSTISYTVTNGCGTTAATQVVTVNPLPVAGTIGGTFTVCAGSTTGLTDAATGGSWSSVSIGVSTVNTSGSVSGVSAGTSIISYTVINGCGTAAVAQVVTVNPLPVPGTISGTATVCTGSSTGLTDAATGGSWSSVTSGVATVNTSGSVSGVSVGTSTISYTVTNGCGTAAATQVITVNPLPVPGTISGTATVCAGSSTGLTDAATGGSWSSITTGVATINTSGSVSGVSAGTSTISYTVTNGCGTATATQLITVNPLPMAGTISGTAAVCSGASSTLIDAATGGSWSSANTSITTVNTSGSFSGAGAGTTTISYIVTNSCGTAAATQLVTVNPLPAGGTVSGVNTVCAGSSITLTDAATGGSWSSTNTGVATVNTSGSVSGISSGTTAISYVVTNICGSASLARTVTVNPLPTITATVTPTALCAGNTLTLNATPSGGSGTYLSFAWTGPGSFTSSSRNATNASITAAGAGIYSVTVTDNNGCSSAPGTTVSVTVNALPTITAAATPNPVCPNNTLTLNATPAGGSGTYSSFSWSGPGGFSALSQNTTNPGMSAAGVGVYSVSVTDNNGCSAASAGTTASVSLYTLPVITATASPTVICVGSNLSLNSTPSGGSGTYSAFTWNGPGSFSASTQNTTNTTIGTAGAGIYSVSVTDNNGCRSLPVGITSPVTVNALPNVTVFSIPSATALCIGGTSTVTINSSSLSSAAYTVTYNLSGANAVAAHTATLVMAAGAGTFIVPSTDLTNSGSTNVTVTSLANALGCTSSLSTGNSLGFTVNPLPKIINGSPGVCLLSTITLSDTTTSGTWSSSSTTVATIGSSTGFLTGLTIGTSVITYSLPTGCFITTLENVNPIPNPYSVTGGGTFCSSSPTVHVGLSGSDLGASYQIYISGTATGGLITGTGSMMDFGVQTVSGIYTVVANPGATCARTMTGSVTVVNNLSPSVFTVSGGGSLCTGGTGVAVGMSYGQPGIPGQPGMSYQLYNGASTVGPAVTGAGYAFNFGFETAAGIYTVIATNPSNSCTAAMAGSAIVVVNPLPPAISGAASVCVGLTTALSDGATGGTWSSGSAGLAIVGSSSGIASGISAGLPIITYTLPTGCTTSAQLTVNPTPTTPGGASSNVCSGSTITLTDAVSGGTWSSSNTAAATIGSASGIVTGGSTSGAVTITYTLPAGCASTTPITINSLPAVFAVTGGGSYCSGGTGVHAGLISSATGVSYQLYLGGTTASGGPVLGTGSALDFGARTGAGAYTTVATNSVTGCTSNMAGSAIVAINPLPTVYTLSGGGSYCSGSTGIDVSLSFSAPGVSYQLFDASTPIGSAVTGTGIPHDFGLQTAGGVYGVIATNSTTGCVSAMSGSPVVTVLPLPTPYAVTGGGSYCSGGTGVHVFLSSSAAGINYQVFTSGSSASSIVTGTGGSIDFGAFTATGIYSVTGTNATTGCSGPMSGSVTVTTNPLPVTTYSVTGGGGYCAGASSTSSVGLSGSLSGTSYQLYVGGTVVGIPIPGTGGILNFGVQSTAGTYTVVGTTGTGCIGAMTGSATIAVNPLPAVFSITGGGSYCSGGAASVHVGLNGSATGINYQIYNSAVAGAVVAGTGSSLDFGALPAGSYTIKATSGAGCVNTMSGSVSVTTNPLPAAFAVSITPAGGYCVGSSAPHVLLSGSVTGVTYQLMLSGGIVGALSGSGASLDYGAQPASGNYAVTATNAATGCSSNMTGSATVVTNPLPTAYTVTGGGTYCAGGTGAPIALSSSTSGVSYQLYIGGIATGGTVAGGGSGISFPAQTATGSYTVIGTYTATSCGSNMTGSVSISTIPAPIAYNVTGGGAYCIGTTTGVHVGLSASNVGFSYQLYIGVTTVVGLAVAGTGGALDFGAQTTTGSYTVVSTNTTSLCTSNMFGSAVVSTVSYPTAYAISASGSYCSSGAGLPVTLGSSATGVNYQLFRGGVPVGSLVAGTGSGIAFGNQTVAGNYTILGTNAAGCSTNMTGIDAISINPLPTVFTVTSTGTAYCTGDTGVHIGLNSSVAGFSYQLYNGGATDGVALAGTGTALDYGRQPAGVYTITAQNNSTSCTNNMSGMIVVTTNPLPVQYAVTGGGNYCSGATGVPVGLGNSDAGVSYQLYLGSSATGTPVAGTTGLPLNFGLQTATGTYTVKATNSVTGCIQTMTGSATIGIGALPALHNVSGGGNYCIGGTGADVYIDGSNTGVSYQLYNGTIPAGAVMPGTGSAVHFGMQTTAGTYTVMATSGAACTDNMTGSVMVVISPLPVVYTLTGGGNYCPSGTGVHIGLSGSDAGVQYQLYNGLVAVDTLFTGTGTSIDFGLQAATGAYTVLATNPATTCTNTMSGIVTVGLATLPTAYSVTGGGGYCAGGIGVAIGVGNSDADAVYRLYHGITPVGAPLSGTGFPVSFGLQTAAGSYTVVATGMATTCTSAMTGSAAIIINPLPDTFSVTGGGQYCTGGSGVAVGLRLSEPGVGYQLYEGGIASGLPAAGTGAAISFGAETGAGIYTVVATNTGTACGSNMPGSALVMVNPLPVAYAVTGGGNYCPGGAGTHIGLSNTTTGITYALYNGLAPTGVILPGTGAAIDFGLITTPGTYYVQAANMTTSCTNNMPGSAVIGISTLPTAYTVTSSAGQYCAGGEGVNILLSGSAAGTSYQLYSGTAATGGPVAGTGSPLNFGTHTGGTYTVVATNIAAGCVNNMAGSAVVSVNPLPRAYAVAGGGNYCPGGSGVPISLVNSTPGVSYQLYRDSIYPAGGVVTGTGIAVDFGLLTATGVYTAVATDSLTGCSGNMAGSATIGISPLPAVNTVTGGGNYCESGSGIAVGLSGSSAGIRYQLFFDGATIGAPVTGTGSLLSFGLQTAIGTYTATATNSASGCSSNMAGSVTVNISPLPTAFEISGGGIYCATGAGFDIGLANSTSGVDYQLYNGLAPSGIYLSGTGLPLDFGIHTAAGSYTLVGTNTTTGCKSTMTGIATIVMNPLPAAYSVTGGGNYCVPGSGVPVGLSNSASGFTYQLFNGATPVGVPISGATGSALDFGLLAAVGTYSVVAVNPVTGCAANMAGAAVVTASPYVTPAVTLSSTGADTLCAGVLVTLNASLINGGTTPAFTWTINGIAVSAARGSLTYAPAVGDVVGVTMTSSALCATPVTVSNALLLMVLPRGMPAISISSSAGDTVCQGSSVTFTEVNAFGGDAPSFTWKVNGINKSTANTYSYGPANGDMVSCVMTSDYQCLTEASAYSNFLNMGVDVPVTPSVTVTASPGASLPQGQTLTLIATLTNAVILPTFQWYINGEPIPGAVGAAYATTTYSNLDTFSCMVTSGGGCSGLKGSNSALIHIADEGVPQVTSTGGDVRIVPNPNNGVFTIKGTLGTTADEQVSVEITDMLGQVIYKDKVMAHGGNIDEKIQLSNTLANGMYILNLRSASANDVFHVVIEQ